MRCISGCIFDVAVDLRRGSKTFGHWVGYELNDKNKYMLYIPRGFAHGFLTLSDSAELIYKTDNEYSLEYDRGLLFNDPKLGINWPIANDMDIILSDKDRNQPCLEDIENNFDYESN